MYDCCGNGITLMLSDYSEQYKLFFATDLWNDKQRLVFRGLQFTFNC